MTSLCHSFRCISHDTNDLLERGATIGFQHAEETLTDNIIFRLAERHSANIKIQTFSKRVEGRNGADWEWWVTDSTRSKWLGMRIQAKVLKHSSREFEHLHYKSGKPKEYQSEKLKREARRDGLIPMYCLYSYHILGSHYVARMCRTYVNCPEYLGCSLTSVLDIENLRAAGDLIAYDDVMRTSMPWHCLICCQGYGGATLPERAWSWIVAQQKFLVTKGAEDQDQALVGSEFGIRSKPPQYVLNLVNDELPADTHETNSSATGLIVITDPDHG